MRGRVPVMDLFWGRYIVCGRHGIDPMCTRSAVVGPMQSDNQPYSYSICPVMPLLLSVRYTAWAWALIKIVNIPQAAISDTHQRHDTELA